jgi:hypothetical protein
LVIEFWASACRDPAVQRRFSAQHERLLQRVAEDLDAAAKRLGVALPLAALDLVRLSTGIAHGLTLEQLMNREAVGADMIELAFASMQRPSTHDGSSASTARTKAAEKRRSNGHSQRDGGG